MSSASFANRKSQIGRYKQRQTIYPKTSFPQRPEIQSQTRNTLKTLNYKHTHFFSLRAHPVRSVVLSDKLANVQ